MTPKLMEFPVARSKDKERYELLADPIWLRRVERQAAKLQMPASVYIRLAVSKQLDVDEGGPAGTAAVVAELSAEAARASQAAESQRATPSKRKKKQ